MANNTVNISASNPASYLYALSVNAPDKVLFTEANIELTAKALYKKASGLNHFLAQSGVSAGDNIAIFLPRGMDAVIAIYAVLMTGACYIPLDTSGPQARNLFIIKDACCRSIVSNDQAPKWLADSGIVTINTDMLPSVSLQEPPGALYSQPDAPAAILYTSGSTGNPKGVVISQRAISAFVQWASNVFNLNVQDVAASLSPFHFDLSLFDLFAVPAAGANTVFIPDALKLSPSRLTDWLAQNTISLWYTVPSILVFIALKGGLDKKNLPQLKQILFAGEVFPMDSLIRLTGLLPETKFYNLFGPTETNVCLYWPVDRKRLTAGEDIPVGYPACEAELGIDPEQGELLVKGPCLMSGYWENGRCEPLLDEQGWFHTGDRVSLNSHHEHSYHGRLDRMLKCSGYRIEPAEIEQVLTAAPGVVACAIIGIADPITGTRIAAAIESEQQDRRILQLFAKKTFASLYAACLFSLSGKNANAGKWQKRLPTNPSGNTASNDMKQENLGVLALAAAENKKPEQARTRFLACAETGFLRHAVAEEFGGAGTSFRVLADSHAQLGEKTHDPGLMLALSAHLWGAVFPLLRFGNDAQKQIWIPSLLNGELIGGHAITESQAGSDVQAMQTTVSETAEGFMLNGHKRYITNSPIAEVMVIYAKHSATSAISAFLVRSDDSGANFEDGPTVKGCATATMGDITLSECEISKDRALGAPGAGATMIQLALELERAFIFAGIAGVMKWQLDHTIQYARRRASGGGALSDHQVISHKIADMKLRLETTRLWVNRCAELLDSKKRITLESAQTKLFASEAFLQSSLDAAHIHGAKGLENGLADLVLDGMAGRLMSGSSEVQRNIIAAMLGVGARK